MKISERCRPCRLADETGRRRIDLVMAGRRCLRGLVQVVVVVQGDVQLVRLSAAGVHLVERVL